MKNKFNASAPYTDMNSLKNGDIVHLPTGTKVSKKEMLKAVSDARVIYIGEQHDNIAAHKAQLDVIEYLYKKYPDKIAVGMEMFRQSAQGELDKITENKLSLKEFNNLFDREWTPQWREAYQMIIDFMHEKSIPVIGLKPTKEIENIVRSGGSSPKVPELDLKDKYHRATYLPFFKGANTTDEAAERKYKMMVLWDEAMAENVAKFLQNPKNKDKKLIVIAGEGHIGYGFGIPKRTYKRMAHNYSTILPTTHTENNTNIPLQIGEYVWKLPYDKLQVKQVFSKKPKN